MRFGRRSRASAHAARSSGAQTAASPKTPVGISDARRPRASRLTAPPREKPVTAIRGHSRGAARERGQQVAVEAGVVEPRAQGLAVPRAAHVQAQDVPAVVPCVASGGEHVAGSCPIRRGRGREAARAWLRADRAASSRARAGARHRRHRRPCPRRAGPRTDDGEPRSRAASGGARRRTRAGDGRRPRRRPASKRRTLRQTRSTIFPKCSERSIVSWARRASASGSTSCTTGRTAPA